MMKWDDRAFKAEMRTKMRKRLIVAATTVRSNAVRSMGSGSSGYRAYLKTKKKIEHYSSMPGEPPHVDTGWLRSSITWSISEGVEQGNTPKGKAQPEDVVGVPEKEEGSIIAVVGTNVKYARALELGYAPRRLAARPYLRPALEKAKAKIQWLFGHE